MGCCYAKADFVAYHHAEVHAAPDVIAAKILDPEQVMKADGAKPTGTFVITPGKAFIVQTMGGTELIEVLERSEDGMKTVTRVTAAPGAVKTKAEVEATAFFVVHERWELSASTVHPGYTTLKKTWFQFEQKSNWFVPLLPAVRSAADHDTKILVKAWSE